MDLFMQDQFHMCSPSTQNHDSPPDSSISPKYLQAEDKIYRTLSVCQLNRQLLKQVSSHLSYRALEILTYFLSSYNSPAKKNIGDSTKGNILITYLTINI